MDSQARTVGGRWEVLCETSGESQGSSAMRCLRVLWLGENGFRVHAEALRHGEWKVLMQIHFLGMPGWSVGVRRSTLLWSSSSKADNLVTALKLSFHDIARHLFEIPIIGFKNFHPVFTNFSNYWVIHNLLLQKVHQACK